MTLRSEAPWTKVPIAMAKDASLTMADLRVYMAIDYKCGKRGFWYGSMRCIADWTALSRPAVARAVAKLRAGPESYLLVERTGIEFDTVLRYVIPARAAVLGPERDISPDTSVDKRDISPEIGEVSGLISPHNTPQTSPQRSGSPPRVRAKNARELYVQTFNREPNDLLRETLANLDAAHPPACLLWAFEIVAMSRDPAMGLAKRIFDECTLLAEHGPRERRPRDGGGSNQRGADQAGRDGRGGPRHGAGAGGARRPAGGGRGSGDDPW